MNRPLILASTSPRRRMLLAELGVAFDIVAPTLKEERLNMTLPLPLALEALAAAKAKSIAAQYPKALVLGADTIVCKDGAVLGKPANADEAARMLHDLSGAKHEVITAVALCCGETGQVMSDHAISYVHFRVLGEEEIQAYIATGEPFDKAGAYGIQGGGGQFVQALDGDFDNVVGLPMALVRRMMAAWKETVR